MKRLFLRILAPIAVAGLIVAGILWLLLQELQQDTTALRQGLIHTQDSGSVLIPGATPELVDSGDKMLIALRQGDLYALQGDWANALSAYQQAVQLDGGIPALRKLATAQLQRRDLEGAKQTIAFLRDAGARGEDLLLLETLVRLRSNDTAGAETLLNSSADSPQKQYGIALLAIVRQDHEAARAALQQVATGYEPALRNYARTLQGAYDEFNLFPESRVIHLLTLLSRALAQVQECELALPLLNQVLLEENEYRDAWTVQGYCQLVTERTPEAMASFEKAYTLDPEKPEIQYFLGRTYEASKDYDNAVTYLQYALENGFQPKREVQLRLAEVAEKKGDIDLAYEQLRQLIATDDNADTYHKFITLALKNQHDSDAFAAATKGIEKWPEDPVFWLQKGQALAVSNRTEEAREAFNKALTIDPTLDATREELKKL